MIDMGISLVMPFYRLPAYYDWGESFPDFIWLNVLKRGGGRNKSQMNSSLEPAVGADLSESISKSSGVFSKPYWEQMSPYRSDPFKTLKTGLFGGFTSAANKFPAFFGGNFQDETTKNPLEIYNTAALKTGLTSGFASVAGDFPAFVGENFNVETEKKPLEFYSLETWHTAFISAFTSPAKFIQTPGGENASIETAEKLLENYSLKVSQTALTSRFTSTAENVQALSGENTSRKTAEALFENYNIVTLQTVLTSGFENTAKIIQALSGESPNSKITETLLENYAPAISQTTLSGDFASAAETHFTAASDNLKSLAVLVPPIHSISLCPRETPQENLTVPFLYTDLSNDFHIPTRKSRDNAGADKGFFAAEKGQSAQASEGDVPTEITYADFRQSAPEIDIAAIIERLSYALREAAENSCEGVHF